MVIFCTGLLGLAFVADFVISKKLRKSKTKILISWNDIYSNSLQTDVVIMGSSRAWAQINPQILDSILGIDSYNLGIDGGLINWQIIKYDAYRRYNKKPKLIIQNIDHNTIDKSPGYEREQFFPYFFDDSLRTAISEYEKFGILEKYLPLYRYIGYNDWLKVEFGIKKAWYINKEIIKGYFAFNIRNFDRTELDKLTVLEYAQESHSLSIFDNYLAKAYSEGIQVIFVYAPIYIEATEKIQNIEGMYQMYDSIARKYDIPILDYNFDPISYDTTYFYIATHLNKKGAEFFSAKLAHDIDSLGILK